MRVIGSLHGAVFELLSDAASRGPAMLDLERCTITGCPTWLGLWLARLRREAPGTSVSAF